MVLFGETCCHQPSAPPVDGLEMYEIITKCDKLRSWFLASMRGRVRNRSHTRDGIENENERAMNSR